jgi:uncharacterized protein YbjT (DUF2867 family)
LRILVTGGSGVLGRQVADRLRDSGHQPVVLSRRERPGWAQGDIATGAGLAQALEDAEVVIHCATAAAEVSRIKATDIEGTRRLVAAAQTAGVRHLVFVSIVGIDGVNYGYYRAKVAAEAAVRAGAVPWSMLRATQYHDLIDRILRALARGPFLFVPRDISFQPVASAEVAGRVAQVATGAPTGKIEDFGGPQVLAMRDLGLAWLAQRGEHRRIVELPIPGRAARDFRAGKHIRPDQRQGSQAWAEWLEQAYAGGRIPTAYGKPSGAGG